MHCSTLNIAFINVLNIINSEKKLIQTLCLFTLDGIKRQ